MSETPAAYVGCGVCDGCDAGDGESPVQLWRVLTLYGPETVEHHVCSTCLRKRGLEPGGETA